MPSDTASEKQARPFSMSRTGRAAFHRRLKLPEALRRTWKSALPPVDVANGCAPSLSVNRPSERGQLCPREPAPNDSRTWLSALVSAGGSWFLLIFCSTLSGAALAAERPGRSSIVLPRNPSVIFIVAEGLGYGQLACYGQKLIQTPNLDRMAAEGVRFTDYYVGSSACPASRYALMTGLHAHRNSTQETNAHGLRAKDWTVASMLKQAGYSTAVFGVWTLGGAGSEGAPLKKGFDQWFGFLDPNHALEAYPVFLWRNDEKMRIPKNDGGKKAIYANDFFTQAAVNFIRLNVKRPFFLYLAYALPDPKAGLSNVTPYGGEKWSQPNKTVAAMITRMDKDIGAILSQLKELRIDQDTAVFFTSDHGPDACDGYEPEFFQSSGPYRGGSNDLFEGSIRVPLIARWPGHIKTNVVSSRLAAAWDLVPTAVEIANMSPPPGVDGVSLMPLLRGERVREREPFYWELQTRTNMAQAIRSGDWKALRHTAQSSVELHDLKNDPGERSNVAEANPGIVAQLSELMTKGGQ